jgi:predicted dehydrogenase
LGVYKELLSVLVDEDVRSVSCRTDRRFHTHSRSEDVALMTIEWQSGLLGTVEIVGGVNAEYYGVEAYGSENIIRAFTPKGDVVDYRGAALGNASPWIEFRYQGTMDAFIEMCRTRQMPVPLEVSEAIARTLLTARSASVSHKVECVSETYG